jgi:hypothetical protein
MKKNSAIKFGIASGLVCLFVFGCAGGGRGLSRTPYCPSNYNPMTVDHNPSYGNKIDVKPELPFNPAAADYAYQDSQIYYYDPVKDIKIHLAQNTAINSGETEYTIVCVGGRGVNQSMAPVALEIPVVSDILVQKNGDKMDTFIRSRTWSFDFRHRIGAPPLQQHLSPPETTYVPGTPQNSYQDNYTNVDQKLWTVKTIPNRYLLIAKMNRRADGVDIRTLVSYKTVSEDDRKKIDCPPSTPGCPGYEEDNGSKPRHR